jgi:ATP-binding cassette subfamily B protein
MADTEETLKSRIVLSLRLGRAFKFVSQSAPKLTVANLSLVIVQGILPLLTLYLMKLVVDAVTEGLTTPDKIIAFKKVLFLIILAGAITLFNTLIRSVAGLIREAQSLIVNDHMQNVIHAKSIEVDLEFYENSQYYDTLHRAQGEGRRAVSIVNGLAQLGRSSISLMAMAGLLLSFHWIFAIILLVAVTPSVIVRLKFAGKLFRWQWGRTPSERKAWYYHWLLIGDRHAKEIRLFKLGKLLIERYRKLRKVIRKERLGISVRRSTADLGAQAIAAIAAFGSYAFFAWKAVQGEITLGDLVMYHQAFQRGQGFLSEMLGGLAGLYEDNLFLSNLYLFLDIEPKIIETEKPIIIPKPMKKGISFEDVSFRYPSSKRDVLKNVNITIHPGEVIALVGENGSGKTTLIKLLCRLYDPDRGRITIDDNDIRNFRIVDLRQETGVIFQDFATYHLTARENIWFGNLDLDSDDESIINAANRSGANEVIEKLPDGYETILGKWFENGEELSIGEWQKVALARAFLRDSQILVMDEPTSAMDAKTEASVFAKFRKLVKGRTAILISHRFSTVRLADNIYVLDDGRVCEGGSHDDLMQLKGKYAFMYEAQAGMYK